MFFFKKKRPDKDIYKTWDGKHFCFTLNKIHEISRGKLMIPEAFRAVADQPIQRLDCDQVGAINGLTVIFITAFDKKAKERYIGYARSGAILVTHVQLKDAYGKPVPSIVLPSAGQVRDVWCDIGRYIKDVFDIPTIAITGTIGKTTTVLFTQYIFAEKHKVFVSGRNRNTSTFMVQQLVRRFGPQFEYHVQETGGGGPGVVERSAGLLRPHAFCITNVVEHHLNLYGTMENYFHDKTSLDRLARDGAFGVINADDERLMNHTFQHRVVTCGIKNKNADFVAENISQEGMYLTLDVVYENKRVPLRIKIPGKHNAYNALSAFALAKGFGISDEEIQAGLLSYRTPDVRRQNITEISGRIMYIDTFNVNSESIMSSLHALDDIRCGEGNRRIAVLTGENSLGAKSCEGNFATGQKIAGVKADEFLFAGIPLSCTAAERDKFGDTYSLYQGAASVIHDREIAYLETLDAAAARVRKDSKPGDVILYKGHFRRPYTILIDKAFGTFLEKGDSNIRKTPVADEFYEGTFYGLLGGVDVTGLGTGSLPVGRRVVIADKVADKPVFRLSSGLFNGHKEVEEIDFGTALRNIGEEAFAGCTGLKHVTVPQNVQHLEQRAFAECRSLETVELQGVEHIERDAFRDCRRLSLVALPETCLTIEENAFAGCPNLKIKAAPGSFAARYAEKNGIELVR